MKFVFEHKMKCNIKCYKITENSISFLYFFIWFNLFFIKMYWNFIIDLSLISRNAWIIKIMFTGVYRWHYTIQKFEAHCQILVHRGSREIKIQYAIKTVYSNYVRYGSNLNSLIWPRQNKGVKKIQNSLTLSVQFSS